MQYQIEVFETVTTLRLYTVEAETLAEAQAKAEAGDTVAEVALRDGEVTGRDLA